MKRLMISTLALLLCLPMVARAQEAKPLVTVSFAGYAELQKDVTYVGELLENPQMGGMLDAMIAMQTQGKGMAGVDADRPWGVMLSTEGQLFPVMGFVPCSDIEEFVGVLEALNMEVTDKGDGNYEVVTPARPMFLRYANDWAYIADTAERLENVPADPIKQLGSLPTKYDLAVLIHVGNLPEQLRQMITANIGMGAAMAAQQQPDETDEQYAMRKMATQNAIEQFTRMLEELDKFLIGVKVDRDEQAAMIDMAVSAQPDTKLAKQFQSLQDAKTNFAGFSADEDAAAWGNWSGQMTDDDVAQVKSYLTQAQQNATQALEDQDLSDEELAKAKVMLDELFAIIVENVETKISDGGFVVKAGEEQLTMIAGGYLADGPKLEGLVKDFVNQLTEEKPELKLLVKLDDGSHDGVNFHRISFPVEAFEEGTEQAKALLGDPVELILGIGPNSIYAAAGKDAESTLKQIIDASKASPEKSIAPGKVVVHMAPIMQAVAGAAQKPEVQAQIAPMTEALEKASGKDGMVIESRPIDNGSVTRITMEEGLIRLIGVAVQQAMAAQAAGQFQAAPGGNF